MSAHWFGPHVAYTMAKYGMSMCVLGMAEEFKDECIKVNALWPRTMIHTAAAELLMGDVSYKFSRNAEIMADAAYHVLSQESAQYSGQFLIDDEVLQCAGVTDLVQYANVKENANKLMQDAFLD